MIIIMTQTCRTSARSFNSSNLDQATDQNDTLSGRRFFQPPVKIEENYYQKPQNPKTKNSLDPHCTADRFCERENIKTSIKIYSHLPDAIICKLANLTLVATEAGLVQLDGQELEDCFFYCMSSTRRCKDEITAAFNVHTFKSLQRELVYEDYSFNHEEHGISPLINWIVKPFHKAGHIISWELGRLANFLCFLFFVADVTMTVIVLMIPAAPG